MDTVSKVIKNEYEKSYLEVEGVPFLYNAVQSWFPPEADYEEYIKRAAQVNYKVFTFWLYWKSLEPVEGEISFAIIDKVLKLADKYDMRLDIVWAGTNFCDHLDPRFAPDWVLSNHDWHQKDTDGKCIVADGYDMGECCAFDPDSKELFEKEKAIIQKLFLYIKQNDKSKRVIMIQVENEINIQGYHGCKEKALSYIDNLAGVIKDVYGIATRVNIITRLMDKAVDNMKNIDAQGLDTYDNRLSVTRRAMLDSNNTKMRYIAENAAYENSSAHIVTAITHGGFYNIYKIDHDTVWDKPGVYGKDWSVMPHTVKIKNINSAINKEAQLIAAAPKENMIEFNCELDDKQQQVYQATKSLRNQNITFKTECGSVAMVVEKDDIFYCFADGEGSFKVNDGEEINYIVGDCLKISK